MARFNDLTNFKGQQYALKDDIIDQITGNLKAQLNPLTIANSKNQSYQGVDFSKLKVIGDCTLIKGSDGQITLRIGPALNCSLFGLKDGISDASATGGASGSEVATVASTFSTNHGNTTYIMKQASDTCTVLLGNTQTTATTAGHSVHFEDNENGKFKIYIGTGANATTIKAYQTNAITASGSYYEVKEYTIDGEGKQVQTETFTAKNAILLQVKNFVQQPKTASGANGYCANLDITMTPSVLFTDSTDFRIIKVVQLEGNSVVATWENNDTKTYFYMKETTKTTPGSAASVAYTLEKSTKVISGVTYLTTSTKLQPTATGLTNIGYPASVSTKATVSDVGGAWFTDYNVTETSKFTTWTTEANQTMSLTPQTTTIAKGKWDNPQVSIKGNNIYGYGTAVQSNETNNSILVCDANGYVESNNGTITYRKTSDYETAFNEAINIKDTTDLQTYNGWIQYPNDDYSSYNKNGETSINPDYSDCEGDRYAYFKLEKVGTIMGGSISFESVESPESELKAGTVKIELANSTTGTWMDLIKGIGTTFSYGTSSKIGFAIPQQANYGNGYLLCKITMQEGATAKIKSITIA